MRAILTLLALSVAAFGCSSTQRSGDGPLMETTGTVQYIELEGGFYGIVADDGRRFDPTNLDESFKEDGLRVHLRGRVLEDAVSIRMWGTIIEIVSIERV